MFSSLDLPNGRGRPSREDYGEVAWDLAMRSYYTKPPLSVHVAFLYGKGGNLLAVATNRLGSRSSGAGYSGCTIHAERAALKMIGDVSLLRGAKMVVLRVNRQGDLLNSEPCSECRRHLEKAMCVYGLTRVYYS
jgi:hypothetical protein